MKDYTRAKRRKVFRAKFRRRVRIWTQSDSSWMFPEGREEFKQQVYKGKACTFLRHTLNPCNCYMCSGDNKYVRQQKQYWFKDQDN